MSDESSPRPWRVEENSLGWKTCIVDANGNDVASCWGGDGINSAEPAQADAALIVAAVNERDCLRAELADKTRNYEYVLAYHKRTEEHLRDIVKRLADSLQGIMDAANGKGEGVLDESLLREARAAIGEDAP